MALAGSGDHLSGVYPARVTAGCPIVNGTEKPLVSVARRIA